MKLPGFFPGTVDKHGDAWGPPGASSGPQASPRGRVGLQLTRACSIGLAPASLRQVLPVSGLGPQKLLGTERAFCSRLDSCRQHRVWPRGASTGVKPSRV